MSISNINGMGVDPYAYTNSTKKTANTGNFAEEVQKARESRKITEKTDSSVWAGDMVIPQPPNYFGFTYDSSISDKSKEEMTMDEYKQWFMNEMSQMPVSEWVRSTIVGGTLTITEDCFERMKNDPEWENTVLNMVRKMYSVNGIMGTKAIGYQVIGASPEQCYGYAGPIGNSGSVISGNDESWWERRHKKMEELMAEQNLKEMLKTQYPGLKYHVMDTSKINSLLWRRNDYPFEMFFEDKLDESVLDWRPSSGEPSMLDTGVQSRLNSAAGKYSVVVPLALEEKLENNPEMSQNILNKIFALIAEQDTIPSTINSFNIALDENGNISNYRFSGSGGQVMMPSKMKLQKDKDEKTEEVKAQERKQKLATKRALQRKEQLEKAAIDKIYQQSMREAIWLYEHNLL